MARRQVHAFVESRCFSPRRGSYVRSAGSEDLDAAVLLGHLYGYGGGHRMRATIDTLARHLRHGPYVDRYSGEDGLSGTEGAFIACSFWLAESLARTGRLVVLHEGWRTHGFGAELVARLTEEHFSSLQAAPLRIGALDLPVPFAPELEQAFRPTKEKLIDRLAAWIG